MTCTSVGGMLDLRRKDRALPEPWSTEMNAMMTTTFQIQPLPAVLDAPELFTLPHRRHSIGGYQPLLPDLDYFNELLARLGRSLPPMDMDRLATAARQLAQPANDGITPACIAQRIARLETVAAMVADPAWEQAANVAECAKLVLGYPRNRHHLIPQDLPRLGQLDDAIVVEAAWPVLGREAASYQAFLGLRAREAYLAGCTPEQVHYDRRDWEAEACSAKTLAARFRQVRESSYVPAPESLFRVH